MPRGVYPRTKNQLRAAVFNLATGRLPAAREKARRSLKKNASNESWREKVSVVTRAAMHRPEVRRKHLLGLTRAQKKHGVGFKGGNGQEPLPMMKDMGRLLLPHGFIPEFRIGRYRADFAQLEKKIVIELDGPSHASMKKRKYDEKRDGFLQSLGWTVIRIKYIGGVTTKARLQL